MTAGESRVEQFSLKGAGRHRDLSDPSRARKMRMDRRSGGPYYPNLLSRARSYNRGVHGIMHRESEIERERRIEGERFRCERWLKASRSVCMRPRRATDICPVSFAARDPLHRSADCRPAGRERREQENRSKGGKKKEPDFANFHSPRYVRAIPSIYFFFFFLLIYISARKFKDFIFDNWFARII